MLTNKNAINSVASYAMNAGARGLKCLKPTTKKAAGAINTNGLRTHTNGTNFPTAEAQGKELATLRAQFALMGHTLQCNHRADDLHVTYWVSKWGQARAFSTLHDVRAFLAQIGGAHE